MTIQERIALETGIESLWLLICYMFTVTMMILLWTLSQNPIMILIVNVLGIISIPLFVQLVRQQWANL